MSELNHQDSEEKVPKEEKPKKSPEQILQEEILEGLKAMRGSSRRLLNSSVAAGLEIGFSLLLMAVMLTKTEGRLAEPIVEMLVAAMYAIGFIFVVLGRSELFTEQTSLAVLPVLNRKASVVTLARLWSIVYVGNLIGAAGFAYLVSVTGPALGVLTTESLGTLARKMVQHPDWVILLSAILAGWMMGLLSWLVAASRDTISQIFVVAIITAAIGFAGLHHVVVGSVEVLAGVFVGKATLAEFGHFLLWATLGNAIGGTVFVASLKSGHGLRGSRFGGRYGP